MFVLYGDGKPQGAVLCTGPNYARVALVLTNEPINDPYIVHKEYHFPCVGGVDLPTVKAEVLAGVAEANAEFGTSLFPIEIQFTIERWSPSLLRRAAFKVIKEIAERETKDL